MRRSFQAIALFVLAGVSGCSLIAGLGTDYSVADGGVEESGSPVDATTESSSADSSGGGADVTAETQSDAPAESSDGTSDAVPDGASDAHPEGSADTGPGDAADAAEATVDAGDDGCSKVTENCTNGVDDNCNGLVDCADPQCVPQGFACTAGDVPAGWTVVAFSATTRPVCPGSYGTEQAVVSNVSGAAASCACACSGTAAQCVGLAGYYYYGTNQSACGTATTVNNANINNGACTGTGDSIPNNTWYELLSTTPTVQQGTCSGSGQVSGSLQPVTTSAGATCSVAKPLGAGCSGNQACVPTTGTTFLQCIAHPGDVNCPAFGFTTKTLASTGNPGYVDSRGCGGCSCSTNLQSCAPLTSMAFYSNNNCTGTSWPIYNSCTGEVAGGTALSYKINVTETGDPSCQPSSGSSPTGTVTLDSNVETICCP
ncbi:MAG TPA: hypothetical protein VIF15_07395 [Polyangiaceae bacterium]|jgi:hypothetical protein